MESSNPMTGAPQGGRLRRVPIHAMLLALLVSFATGFAAEYSLAPLNAPSTPPSGGTPFTRLGPEQTGMTVANSHDDPRMWGELFRELTLGSLETGIAVADFNRDGLLDIFSVSKNGPCALYLQEGSLRFRDVAGEAGVEANDSTEGKAGATAVDINQDGWMDLYVCFHGAPNLLFVNNGDGTFSEQAEAYRLDIADASVHAVFADYDRDGDLDAYLVTNILRFAKSPQGQPDFLLRNNGDGTFSDVSRESGIWGISQGHTAIWFDPNHDGWPDLYVANDFETPDRFYLNQQDGTFVDVVDEQLPHVTYFSMGADSGDVNNDGLVDFFVGDMRDRTRAEYMAGMEEMGRGLWEMERVRELIPQYAWNAFYLNTGTPHFKEMAWMTGLAATGWTWAPRLIDFDNDGRLDFFTTNGMIRNFIDADLVDRQKTVRTLEGRARVWKDTPVRSEPNLAFRNDGDLVFTDVSAEWGLDHVGVSFGCAAADFDGDGDIDLVYSNYDAPPTLMRNDFVGGNRLVVELRGRAPNRRAIGAEIALELPAGTQVRQVYPERGIVGSEPVDAAFGLGEQALAPRLTVHWPDGAKSVLRDVPAGNRVIIRQPPPPSAGEMEPPVHKPEAWLVESAIDRGLDYNLSLLRKDELSRQRLLPRRLNGQGPGLAGADVNGDGWEDVFVTGSTGQGGRLFFGRPGGRFSAAEHQPWEADAAADDLDACFIDVNGDGTLDLYVAAGGVELEPGDDRLQDRLYLNDGAGKFTPADFKLPATASGATGALAPADFDGDGDTDLFVGGRYIPGRWPDSPRSFLFENREGRLVDVTQARAPALVTAGMITDAAFADIDADGRPDLVLSREWGPVTCLMNREGGFVDATADLGLAAYTGWWSALVVHDFNGDGRPDIAAGNTGLNTKYDASMQEPATLFVVNADGAADQKILEGWYDQGALYPVRGLSKMRYEFPRQLRPYRTSKDYAKATLVDIFGADFLGAARKLEATTLASGIFIQQPDGRFHFQPLPREAQLAPIYCFAILDANDDGVEDLFVAGNAFGPEPSTGRFDGGVGLLMTGEGNGRFHPVSPHKSGISIPGETRDVLVLREGRSGGFSLVVARTNGPLLLFGPR